MYNYLFCSCIYLTWFMSETKQIHSFTLDSSLSDVRATAKQKQLQDGCMKNRRVKYHSVIYECYKHSSQCIQSNYEWWLSCGFLYIFTELLQQNNTIYYLISLLPVEVLKVQFSFSLFSKEMHQQSCISNVLLNMLWRQK